MKSQKCGGERMRAGAVRAGRLSVACLYYNRIMIAGLILAAGESKRIGTPKALLKVGDEAFVERITRIMHECDIKNVILVTGAHHDEIRAKANDVIVVFNPQHQLGQFTSLQIGLSHLPAKTKSVLVWPVDLPLVQKETVLKLLHAARKEENPITVPVHDKRKGHPVVYSSETVMKIQSMEPSHTGKDLFEYFESRISRVEVEDAAILIDIDTPEDYEKHVKPGRL